MALPATMAVQPRVKTGLQAMTAPMRASVQPRVKMAKLRVTVQP
jgi:hypothetical protein